VQAPLGTEKSEIDVVLAIKDIYRILLPYMSEAKKSVKRTRRSGGLGIGWGRSGGEARALGNNDYIVADGIENVIHVLEGLEDEKFDKVSFIELNACDGGCVGGVLNIENPHVGRAKIRKFEYEIPATLPEDMIKIDDGDLLWSDKLKYEPVFQLGSNFMESLALMKRADEVQKKFPGLDCGCCGAPSCRAQAEDVVKGVSTENACIHILKDRLHLMSKDAEEFVNTTTITLTNAEQYAETMRLYINKISSDIAELDNTIGVKEHENDSELSSADDLDEI